MTQTIRHIFRWLNLAVIVGAFFLIEGTELTQATMAVSFLILAHIEGGLFLWDAGARVQDGTFQRWLTHGSPRGPNHNTESGLGSAFVTVVWTTLGIGLLPVDVWPFWGTILNIN